MNPKKIKRIFIILLLSFVAIFILFFVYGLIYNINQYDIDRYYKAYLYSGNSYSSISIMRPNFSNIATEKQIISGTQGVEVNYEQKYEMVSEITSISDDFENDAAKLRKTISEFNGVVQTEYSGGLEKDSDRSLTVSIGIPPSKFDSLVEQIKLIGDITSFSVNKTDKTAEYLTCLAQREALEKTLESYISLRTQSDRIADLLLLEEKIIKTEEEILETGVTLGIYDESQSMCTVYFTLSESASNKKAGLTFYDVTSIVIQSAGDAALSALAVYLIAILFIVGTGFSALGIAFVLSRIAKQSTKKSETAQTTDDKNTDN